MAGLPGSGLGGLFYILLLLWVFVRQAFAGSLAPARFKDMIPLAGMAVAMVAALAVAAWLVARAFGPLPTFASLLAPSDRTGRSAYDSWDYTDHLHHGHALWDPAGAVGGSAQKCLIEPLDKP